MRLNLPIQVGERQKRRKMAELHVYMSHTLEPCYGLTPTAVTAVTEQGTSLQLTLSNGPVDDQTESANDDTTQGDQVARTLYILDRFGISDEAYHALTQVHAKPVQYWLHKQCACTTIYTLQFIPELPRLHHVKAL